MNHIQYSCLKSHAVGTGALSSVTSFCHDTVFSAHYVTAHYVTAHYVTAHYVTAHCHGTLCHGSLCHSTLCHSTLASTARKSSKLNLNFCFFS